MKCGKPVKDAEQEYCRDCLDARHEYDRGAALWVHKPPVNTSVYQFKFHNRRSFGSFYTERILRDKAYLLLETRPLVGVISWEEVSWDQVPEAAQALLTPPEG